MLKARPEMRGIQYALVCALLTACAADVADLEWVQREDSDMMPIGDPIELAVITSNPDTVAVRFDFDGTEIASCVANMPEEDCKRDDVWRWTTVFSSLGTHELMATSLDANGDPIESVTRTVTIVRELPPDIDELQMVTELAATRGYLDPDRAYHNIFGGIQWRLTGQKVVLHTGTPSESVSAVTACMNRYGASIRKWADHYGMSRGSVIATALTESNCTNPAGSSDGLSSGPMQVTASTCASLMGLSRSTCRSRMHTSPDFSFQVGTKYMATSYQRNQHKHDPPKIAAAYNAGSLRSTSANRWHMVSTGNHIDRFVRWYNAYRAWELR
jgi:hypothetical protein